MTDLTLRQLEAEFVKFISKKSYMNNVDIKNADGVRFLCPKCYITNKGPIGTHSILCWQPHIPQDIYPTPGRWNLLGTGIDDLELKAGSSSVLLTGGCRAHFFVRGGSIQMT